MKWITLVLIFAISCAGCATNQGPGLVGTQRFDYSEEFNKTDYEQMVANLVRLRYAETPVFLEISSIVTQYTVKNFAQAGISSDLNFVPGARTSAGVDPSVSANMTFEERPTISYTPLQGEEFAKRILSPVLTENIFLLSESGWSISRLMRICLQTINGYKNAVTAAGPTPERKPDFEEFMTLVNAIRFLQKEELIEFKISRAEGAVSTYNFMLRPIPSGAPALEEQAAIVRKRLGSPESPNQGKVTTKTRSLLSILFYLSHSVEPPEEHIEKEYVTVTRDENGNVFDWNDLLSGLLSIKSQKKKPEEAFVAVRHNDYWFYVDKSDVNSKNTLSLLSYLKSLQSAEAQGDTPLLTIS